MKREKKREKGLNFFLACVIMLKKGNHRRTRSCAKPWRKNCEKRIVNAEEISMSKTNGKKMKKIGWIMATVVLSVVCFFGGMATVWFTLDKQMRTLIKVKKTIDENYYQEIDDESFYSGIFDAVNEQLDAYSGYMTSEGYTSSSNDLNGRRIGIGVSFSTAAIAEGKLKIVRVAGNSPAERAGMTSGSYLTGFGRTEATLVQSENYDEFLAFLEEMKEGESFLLQVQTAEESKLVSVSREAYVENYVFYRSQETSYGFTGENATTLTTSGTPLTALPDDTAYIRLVRFGGAAVTEFEGAMSVFKQENKKNLVLDLRGNGGGYLNVMQGIASFFCKGSNESTPVAAIADYGDHEEWYLAKKNVYGDYFKEDSRICILADSGSASAAECLIGVLVDYGASSYADICLSERSGVAKTYGKGIMQQYFTMSVDGDVLKLTTAQVRWPVTKYSIHGRGVLPEDGTKTVEEGATDEAELEAAIQALF